MNNLEGKDDLISGGYDYRRGCYVGQNPQDWPNSIGSHFDLQSNLPTRAPSMGENNQKSERDSTYVSVYNPEGKPDRRDGFYKPTLNKPYPKITMAVHCRNPNWETRQAASNSHVSGWRVGDHSQCPTLAFDTRILFPKSNSLRDFEHPQNRDSAVQSIDKIFRGLQARDALGKFLSLKGNAGCDNMATNRVHQFCLGAGTLIYDPRFHSTAEGNEGPTISPSGRYDVSELCKITIGDTDYMLSVRGAMAGPEAWTDGETVELSESLAGYETRETVLRHQGPTGSDSLLEIINETDQEFVPPSKWPHSVFGTAKLW